MSRLSIRSKLLLVFTILFTFAFAMAFVWFNQFATKMVMDYLRQNLTVAASTAANMIDPAEHAQVFAAGVEDTPEYAEIAAQLRLVQDSNPTIAAIYTTVKSPNPDEVLFVVSADEDLETRVGLGEAYDTSDAPEMPLGFEGPIADVEYGADEWGVWLSGYAPIRDAQGQAVGMVGVDMLADDVLKAQANVRNASLVGFGLAYIGVFAAVYLLSGSITKSLSAITGAARALEQDQPYDAEQLAKAGRGSDEVAQLARVFSQMAVQVQAREQELKKQVSELRIEIDQAKRAAQVAEIVETDYFQNLQTKAKEMRDKRGKE